MVIQLTEQDIKDLTNFADEIPTKYGLPIIQFLNKKIEEQKQDEREI